MRLALRELRRRPGRFVTAVAILTLVAALVMILGGLLDGLLNGSTGALRAQNDPMRPPLWCGQLRLRHVTTCGSYADREA